MAFDYVSGDLAEFVFEGTYNESIQVRNVFHYAITGGIAGGAINYAAGMYQNIILPLLSYTNQLMIYEQIRARKLDTHGVSVDEDIFLIPAGEGIGLDTGEALPSYAAWAFRYQRPDATFRHGYKRFAGVSEDHQQNGISTGLATTALVALAIVLSLELNAYDIDAGLPTTSIPGTSMQPVVLRRVLSGDIVDPVDVGVVTSVVFLGVSTQSTRKVGRGA